jgi:hypothetical protein
MTNTTNLEIERAALERLVDIYGGDRQRWPVADQMRFSTLISIDSQARQIVDEAAALEQVLFAAPIVTRCREGVVADRIMAQIRGQPLARLQLSHQPLPRGVIPLRSGGRARGWLSAPAALLAASLMLGVGFGVTGLSSPLFHAIAEAVGLTDEGAELALLAEEPFSSGEEAL